MELQEILILLVVLVGLGILLYFLISGSGSDIIKPLGDTLNAIGDIAETGGTAVSAAASLVGVVNGNQKLGEPCKKGELACGPGLSCDDERGVCANSTAKVGERCTAGSRPSSGIAVVGGLITGDTYKDKGGIECESGAHCVENKCYPAPKNAGDSCYPNKLKCPSNLTCYPRIEWGKCFPDPAPEGGFCSTTGDNKIKCGSGLTCFVNGGTTGTCKKDWASEGEFCVAAGQDNKIKCRDGLTCWPRTASGGKCYANRNAKLGELCIANATNEIRCGSGLTCWPRNGTAGKCYNTSAARGEPCVTGNVIKCAGSARCSDRSGTSMGTCQ
jgi:hypothetical protein